nr:SH3 domain-containing protein C23A1.17-like [Aegilops tauschii subsp. strangulata]
MSSPPPTLTLPLPTVMTAPIATMASAPLLPVPVTSAAPLPVVFTPEEMTTPSRDLTQAVTGIYTFLARCYGSQPPVPFANALPPQQPPSSTTLVAAAMQQLPWQPPPATNPGASTMQQGQQLQLPPPATAALGIPTTDPGVPIHQVRFPPSPSPLPAWLAGSLEQVYMTASVGPHMLPPPATHPAMQFGGSSGYAEPFASVDGPLFQDGTLMPACSASSSSMRRADEAHPPVVQFQSPPRFSKLEFATYDGTVDPLNWLNQCDQFFRG